jgi:hypothetical protein
VEQEVVDFLELRLHLEQEVVGLFLVPALALEAHLVLVDQFLEQPRVYPAADHCLGPVLAQVQHHFLAPRLAAQEDLFLEHRLAQVGHLADPSSVLLHLVAHSSVHHLVLLHLVAHSSVHHLGAAEALACLELQLQAVPLVPSKPTSLKTFTVVSSPGS